MAIKVSLDESYCYDMLSILLVKVKKASNEKREKAFDNWLKMSTEMAAEIGNAKHSVVIDSVEYKNLYDVNDRLYDLVDAVKKDPCLGKQLDDEVYNRYLAKKALQERFFPEVELKEQKFGYNEQK